MFDTLFSYQAVVSRHRDGALAAERAAYLEGLSAQGMARTTVLRHASYCLCLAEELERWPPDHRFGEDEVRSLSEAWAAKRVIEGRASGPRWSEEQFRSVAIAFLREIGRFRSLPAPEPSRHQHELDDFVATQQERRWASAATCRTARWQITRFLDFLELRNIELPAVTPDDIDVYFRHMGHRWSRGSLLTSAKMLRAWFTHCERRCWSRPGLSAAVLLPRVYRHEGLPIGPTWGEVGDLLDTTSGDDPVSRRDHAIILLLSVYGLRSGEVRRLRIEDLDWAHERIRVVRAKSGREETLPLEPRVGNAIMCYLRDARPRVEDRTLFLTVRAPPRPLSPGGLHGVVSRRFSRLSPTPKRFGPHALRHACARHLIEAGRTFKEIGDHLGHRSPDATRHYAKVDLTSLRKVASTDLGALV